MTGNQQYGNKDCAIAAIIHISCFLTCVQDGLLGQMLKKRTPVGDVNMLSLSRLVTKEIRLGLARFIRRLFGDEHHQNYVRVTANKNFTEDEITPDYGAAEEVGKAFKCSVRVNVGGDDSDQISVPQDIMDIAKKRKFTEQQLTQLTDSIRVLQNNSSYKLWPDRNKGWEEHFDSLYTDADIAKNKEIASCKKSIEDVMEESMEGVTSNTIEISLSDVTENKDTSGSRALASLPPKKRAKTEEPSRCDPKAIADLTHDQRKYRKKFFDQLTYGDANSSIIPLQAFCPRVTFEQKKQAAEYAIRKAIEEHKLRYAKKQEFCSSSAESCAGAGTQKKDLPSLDPGQIQFFKNLSTCLPLTTGFDLERKENIRFCHCPCGKYLENWRAEDTDVNKLLDKEYVKNHDTKKNKVFVPIGLMDHLKKIGGSCILHFGTWNYIEKLYENYNGLGECIFCSSDVLLH